MQIATSRQDEMTPKSASATACARVWMRSGVGGSILGFNGLCIQNKACEVGSSSELPATPYRYISEATVQGPPQHDLQIVQGRTVGVKAK